MPARDSQPVRKLTDYSSDPVCEFEACTVSEHALAFQVRGATFDGPDHHAEHGLTAQWLVIPHRAPADVVPVLVTWARERGRWCFETEGASYTVLSDAMDAAVLGPATGFDGGRAQWSE